MEQTVKQLLKTIDEAVGQFMEGVSPIQEQSFRKLMRLVKELDLDGDNIKNNLKNLNLIGEIKNELDGIIISKPYLKSVTDFVGAYDTIATIQNDYFATLSKEFTPKKVYEAVKQVNVDNTIELLTENGIGSAYTDEIKQVLVRNITAGGSYADMTEQLREMMIEKDGGLLNSYAKQITTDAINQYNASYNVAVSSDLGLSWYQYTGSLLTTSRPFCKAMVAKRYFHISEIPDLLKGHISDGVSVPVNPKTDLPYGMIEGTNKETFMVNRGGYSCGHIIHATIATNVPMEIRKQFEKDLA